MAQLATASSRQHSDLGELDTDPGDPPPISLPVTVDILAVLKGGSEGWAGHLFRAGDVLIIGLTQHVNIQFDNSGGQMPAFHT